VLAWCRIGIMGHRRHYSLLLPSPLSVRCRSGSKPDDFRAAVLFRGLGRGRFGFDRFCAILLRILNLCG
jgi:hypothetical protein